MLIRAPHRIRQIIPLPHNPHMLIRILREVILAAEYIPLDQIIPPKLNIHMFTLITLPQQLLRHRDNLAVKVVAQRNARERKQRRHDIRMAAWKRLFGALRHPRAANEEGDVDVFFDVTALSWREAVLADVVAIVGRVDEVGVVQDAWASGQAGDDGVDQLINGLQGLQARAVPGVVVVDLGLVELPEGFKV